MAAAEGQASAAIAERWLDLQPEGFLVRGEDDEIRGFMALLDLTVASEHDRDADPGAQAAWDYAHRRALPRAGEVITQTRFVVDQDAYHGPSPTLNAVPIATLQRYLRKPLLAWDFLALQLAGAMGRVLRLADLPRATGADFLVGGRRYGLYRPRLPPGPGRRADGVMDRAGARSGRHAAAARGRRRAGAVASGFNDAVRQALRDLHRPELLARNPLARTRLARDYAGLDEPDLDALAGLLRAAVDALGEDPRDDKLLRAVDRTYLRPRAHSGGCRRAARLAVQHLPAAPLQGRAAHRRLAVGPRGVRHGTSTALSHAEHDPTGDRAPGRRMPPSTQEVAT